MQRRVPVAIASILSAIALTAAATQPALAADATWFDGQACHNVWRTESGSTLSQSRTGIRGSGGSTAGMSRITVYFGDAATTVWAGEATVTNARSFRPGRFTIFFSGGKDGECTGKSYGTALDVSRPREGATPASAYAAELDNWRLRAEPRPDGAIELSAARDERTHEVVFDRRAVANGAVQFEVGSGAARSVITYDPARSERFSIEQNGTLLPPPVSAR
jgi:hypothetical protein